MKCICILVALAVGTSTAAARGNPAKAARVVNEQIVGDAIGRAAEWLLSSANEAGVWDDPDPPDLKRAMQWKGPAPLMKTRWPGATALVLNALAAAERQSDPRFRKALDWLMKQKMVGTYGRGMRIELIHRLKDSARYRAVLKKDARRLLRALRAGKEGAMWQYTPPLGKYFYTFAGDFSNTNYGVLGLWAASDERLELPSRLWRALERTYVSGQLEDGGWTYYHAVHVPAGSKRTGHAPSASMTTAGIASLYLVLDQLHIRRGGLGAFRRTDAYKSIQRGLAWMEKNFSATTNPGWPEFATYYFYNCERVAAAAGIKYFGTRDWFREIAASLLGAQRPNGAIPYRTPARYGGVPVDTAFALLFLAEGSAPIICKKLQHAGDWDNHIRELAALTGWLARQSERPANWQVVNLKVPAEELTDSRILYVAGTKALAFTAEEKTKLKRYVELGGLLVFHPDRPSIAFQGSVARLLGELWPRLELTSVDLSAHPLGTIYLPLTGVRARVQQLATPTRVVAFLAHGGPARAWERRQYLTARPMFVLGPALHYFANDRCPLRRMPTKLTHFAEVFRKPFPPTDRTIVLARIRYGDNPHRWDPEPLALQHFARLLAARENVNCELKVVTPAQLPGCGAKVAHLIGVDAVELDDKQWAAIDKWLKAGGTLLTDQAGGPKKGEENSFDSAFRKAVALPYGETALPPMPKGRGPLAGLEKCDYRHLMGRRRLLMRPRLECVEVGGRTAIVYSRYDLACGLLGNPNPLAIGADAQGRTGSSPGWRCGPAG